MSVFVGSKANSPVYWDQVDVTFYKGTVLEENHYYPFGLTLSTATTNPAEKNSYKLTTKELEDKHGLNWYNFGARMQDMQIGRWNQIDELAEDYYEHSPYNFVGNNPTNRIDPDGRGWWDKVVGVTYSALDNATGINLRDTYHPSNSEDAHDYNTGQDIGDIASLVIGSGEAASGGSIAAGSVGVTAASGGLTIEITAPAAVLGSAMTLHGAMTAKNGLVNFSSQKGRANEGNSSNQGNGQGRGKNNRSSDPEATGDHSVSNDRGSTTYKKNDKNPTGFQESKRVDTKGGA